MKKKMKYYRKSNVAISTNNVLTFNTQLHDNCERSWFTSSHASEPKNVMLFYK